MVWNNKHNSRHCEDDSPKKLCKKLVMAGLIRHPLKIEYGLLGDCGSPLRYVRNDTALLKQGLPVSFLTVCNDVSKGFLLCLLISLVFLTSCSISYKFEGGSVNYDLTKTIHIADFPNRTPFYSPLASMFNLALRKRFIEQTRLKEVSSNADIEMEGEINNFDVAGLAVKADAYSSQTRLTITVHVQYTNNKEQGKNVDQSFSSFKEFPSTQSLDDVQDTLVPQIIADLVDMIYNATVANW